MSTAHSLKVSWIMTVHSFFLSFFFFFSSFFSFSFFIASLSSASHDDCYLRGLLSLPCYPGLVRLFRSFDKYTTIATIAVKANLYDTDRCATSNQLKTSERNIKSIVKVTSNWILNSRVSPANCHRGGRKTSVPSVAQCLPGRLVLLFHCILSCYSFQLLPLSPLLHLAHVSQSLNTVTA